VTVTPSEGPIHQPPAKWSRSVSMSIGTSSQGPVRVNDSAIKMAATAALYDFVAFLIMRPGTDDSKFGRDVSHFNSCGAKYFLYGRQDARIGGGLELRLELCPTPPRVWWGCIRSASRGALWGR